MVHFDLSGNYKNMFTVEAIMYVNKNNKSFIEQLLFQ